MEKLRRSKVVIERVVEETPTIKSLYFNHPLDILPGQFVMLTDYSTGEKPLSVSFASGHAFALTVKQIGEFTRMLHSLKEGDELYVRGPYGNSFILPDKPQSKVLLVGGGCGTAPIRHLLDHLMRAGVNQITLINGGRSGEELLFNREFSSLPISYHPVTDDGSYGDQMNTSQKLHQLLTQDEYEMVYVVGPELMMRGAYEELATFPVSAQFLMERYMKCGVGICGQCTLDPVGIRVCIEGPVILKEDIPTFTEFGNYTRDAYGKRVSFISCG